MNKFVIMFVIEQVLQFPNLYNINKFINADLFLRFLYKIAVRPYYISHIKSY